MTIEFILFIDLMILEEIDTYMCYNKLEEAWNEEAKFLKKYTKGMAIMEESLKKSLESGEFNKISEIDEKVNKIVKVFTESPVLGKY